ncbi:DUF4376 domain-containing protein [Candidatus Agathobaculum pullicola]|uniref:DUF4376 domain-containing protein n=1 Tax=Candidatus Agathobaculum pullicola TaxID=2838426 RepID=UPI003F91B233
MQNGTLRDCCAVDAGGLYRALVTMQTEQGTDGEPKENVLGYTLAEGERLIDTAPPTKRLHAGTTGFVKPRWDEDATAWVEGATAEELAAWEAEHPDPVTLEDKRAAKHAEISAASEAAIYAGMDVETTQGTEHFSLTEKDQINLTTAKDAVDKGAAAYPYHADDVRCRIFTAEEIKAIAQASVAHIIYHTTYCNHLFEWIRRADAAELAGITYGAELPDDLAAHMQEILTQAGAVAETEAVT